MTRGGATGHAAGTLTGPGQKAVGNGRIGVLPNLCGPRGRSRRAARISAAMLAPECLRQQSLRHYVQVESCQPPFWIGTIDIWMRWAAVKTIIVSPSVAATPYPAPDPEKTELRSC